MYSMLFTVPFREFRKYDKMKASAAIAISGSRLSSSLVTTLLSVFMYISYLSVIVHSLHHFHIPLLFSTARCRPPANLQQNCASPTPMLHKESGNHAQNARCPLSLSAVDNLLTFICCHLSAVSTDHVALAPS